MTEPSHRAASTDWNSTRAGRSVESPALILIRSIARSCRCQSTNSVLRSKVHSGLVLAVVAIACWCRPLMSGRRLGPTMPALWRGTRSTGSSDDLRTDGKATPAGRPNPRHASARAARIGEQPGPDANEAGRSPGSGRRAGRSLGDRPSVRAAAPFLMTIALGHRPRLHESEPDRP